MVLIEYRKPIATIVVRGDHLFLTREDLKLHILEKLGRGSYWSINLGSLRERLERHPWIAQVNITRQANKVIDIAFIEQRPIAKWNDRFLINQSGEAFDRLNKEVEFSLPLIRGPDYLLKELQQEYRLFNDVFRAGGVEVSILRATEDGQRYVRLNNDVQIMLGAQDIEDNILRFTSLWNTLSNEQKTNVDRIDMRYDNAAAIAWR